MMPPRDRCFAIASDDSVFKGGVVSFGARVTPGNLVIDNANTLVLTNAANAYGLGEKTVSWTKKGDGTLVVGLTGTSGADGNVNLCQLDVEGGKVMTGSGGYNLFGRRSAGTAHVLLHPGSSFDLCHEDANGGLRGWPTLKVTVETNASFNVLTDYGSIGSLVVNGGSVTLSGRGAGRLNYGTLFLQGGLIDIGPAPEPFVLKPAQAEAISVTSPANLEVRVADITGDEQADATFGCQIIRRYDSGDGLVKTGSGKMVYAPSAVPNEHTQLNRDIVVEEGELELAAVGAVHPGFGRTIRVNTNATLRITKGYAMAFPGSGVSGYLSSSPIQTNVIDHGSLILGPDTTADAALALGSLVLDHATFDYSTFGGSSCGVMLGLGDLFRYIDDKPVDFKRYGNNNLYRAGFNLNANNTTFDVCRTERPEGVDYDMCISLNLKNSRLVNAFPDCGFVKTGPGTLCLNGYYTGDGTGFHNSFTGDIEVREGELQIGAASDPYRPPLANGNSFVGNIDTARMRTITVQSGATLHFKTRAVMGVPSNEQDFTNEVKNVTVVLNGGTLTNETLQLSSIPNLTINDGAYIYGQGFWTQGVLFVPGTLKVTGTKPCVFPKTAAWQFMGINGYPETVFDVDDVTQSAAADLTFDIPLGIEGSQWDGAAKRYNHKYGFVKRGSGTMRLAFGLMTLGKDAGAAGQCINFDGDATVEAGVLRVDGNISNSDTVKIAAGAAVAGTGTVNNVSIAVGGGFAAQAGSAEGLRVNGDLTLGETGFVDIAVPPGEDVPRKVKLATVFGRIVAPSDLSGWKFRVNGVEDSAGSIRLGADGKSLVAGGFTGMAITIH